MAKKLLVIEGLTATGKTDLGLNLAKKYNGEIVSADSRQVYKNLDIGTGKMPGKDLRFKKYDLRWEIDDVNVWMYDVISPKVIYTVADYVKQAWQVIEDIEERGKLPIIVGGSGLYIKALLEELPNLEVPVDLKLREELSTFSLKELQEKLIDISPEKWQNLNSSDRQNPRRLLRSIEIVLMYPHDQINQKAKIKRQKYNILKVGLVAPREILKKRIDARLISRIDQGMVEEGKRLFDSGVSLERMDALGLEYRYIGLLLSGKISHGQFVTILSTKIYQYAKRQETWFKKEKEVNWFDVNDKNYIPEVEKLVDFWYHSR